MMFTASPPWVMMPCTRASARICRRRALTPTNVWMTASSALTPRSGAPAACEALPWNTSSIRLLASELRRTMSLRDGCSMKAASTSSNTPASARRILPPPPSSAGVPMITTRPGNRSPLRARARPAPSALEAMMLWPHACPMPGSASYSARIASVGPGSPPSSSARNAVASPPTPRATRRPPRSSSSASRALARCPLNRSSGFAWMSWLVARRGLRSSSTAVRMRAFHRSRSMPIRRSPLRGTSRAPS